MLQRDDCANIHHRQLGPNQEADVKETIVTDAGPKAIGPYSQAIRANGFLFVSGQIALDPRTQELVPGDITQQTERVLENLKGILQAAGSSMEKVVRTTVFLADMNEFGAMNQAYAKYFRQECPARSTVQAARLPRDVRVEIDVIALA
jgi:2-iminobutanoate/2-iminopropanoate deaminase